ncbi:hypothetical protein [Leptolyngbya sp. O-77]
MTEKSYVHWMKQFVTSASRFCDEYKSLVLGFTDSAKL